MKKYVNDMRSNLKIEMLKIDTIKFNPQNPRIHSDKQIGQLATSLSTFGFITPILVDRASQIIAGNAITKAAMLLGMDEVPAIRIEHLSDPEIRAFIITHNKLALNAEWNDDILRSELSAILDLKLDFEITVTGFEFAEIDAIISFDDEEPATNDPLDYLPDMVAIAVTKIGDCWRVGDHKLVCGDATQNEPYETLFADEPLAQMVFEDPPYNVRIKGHVSGLGKNQHDEFVMASGEMKDDEFTDLLTRSFEQAVNWSQPGSLHYQCMDWRHGLNILEAGKKAYSAQLNLCVWCKTNGGMGSLYRSKHELVYVFKNGYAPHINNVQLGKNGRYRTNVWDYAGANSFGATRNDDLAMHPTVKPVALVADAILDASEPRAVILDGFAGSGTTLIAVHKTRRRGFGIELDPRYCDLIIKRLTALTGYEALLEKTGESFAKVQSRRAETAMGEGK